MSLDELSKGVSVKRRENVQRGQEKTQTFNLVKDKSHKRDQGEAREAGRKLESMVSIGQVISRRKKWSTGSKAAERSR